MRKRSRKAARTRTAGEGGDFVSEAQARAELWLDALLAEGADLDFDPVTGERRRERRADVLAVEDGGAVVLRVQGRAAELLRRAARVANRAGRGGPPVDAAGFLRERVAAWLARPRARGT